MVSASHWLKWIHPNSGADAHLVLEEPASPLHARGVVLIPRLSQKLRRARAQEMSSGT